MRPITYLASLAPARCDPDRSFGILSSFPPTPCGIATYSAALASGLIANQVSVDVVRCGVSPAIEDALVLASVDNGERTEVTAAIEVLNRSDVALIQHEYGLYHGPAGASVLELMDGIRVPMIVIAHTVLSRPSADERLVLERVCDLADVVVVMTATARARLVETFDVAPTKVVIIPHGAATPVDEEPAGSNRFERRTGRAQLLTWGLLGPGKGIEWAIDAVGSMSDLRPRPSYLVAGATHPKVLAHSGESYREMLCRRAWISGAVPYVSFDDTYRDLSSLTELIRSADLVVLPYDSEDQVTSGVLVDAIAAGRPVVATAFPHAVELLGSGAGLVVPQRDARALAMAIRRVLTEPGLHSDMAAEARRLAPELSWTSVARRYDALADRLIVERQSVGA